MVIRQPTKKAITYIKTMISKGSFKEGETLPPLDTISKKLKVSYPTVRKAVSILIRGMWIENMGKSGFYVIPRQKLIRSGKDLQRFLLSRAGLSLKIAEHLANGFKLFGRRLVMIQGKNVLSFDTVTEKKTVCRIEDLERVLTNPTTIEEVNNSNGTLRAVAKRRYERDQLIKEIALLVSRHKSEL